MPVLYLVRHGCAAAGWDSDPDPGLSETGHSQVQALAARLAPLGPMPLRVSPMKRTRETAEPLAERFGGAMRIEPRVSEIVSPTDDLEARGRWLRQIAACRWPELDSRLNRWREALIAALLDSREDTVYVTHFIAINAAVGYAIGDERVVHCRPDHCSVTVLTLRDGRLQLHEQGEEARTRVL